MILPEGLRDVLSVDTTKEMTFSTDGWGMLKYPAQIRTFCIKLPGFLMTSYQAISKVLSVAVIPED